MKEMNKTYLTIITYFKKEKLDYVKNHIIIEFAKK